ncbi:hypothetical protein J4211_04055 [Candidatus Woesearchaeota archaeon]|nr:hypothetical protein [Candidatus Woesearchaeota archaeon]
MLTHLALFIVFGILGWIVDTAYRSYDAGKYHPHTMIPGFSIIYGLGGVLLLMLFKYTQLPVIADIVVGGTATTTLEFIGGWFCHKVLARKMWDYSEHPYNYYGYIDAEHTIYWFILTGAVRFVFAYLPI